MQTSKHFPPSIGTFIHSLAALHSMSEVVIKFNTAASLCTVRTLEGDILDQLFRDIVKARII